MKNSTCERRLRRHFQWYSILLAKLSRAQGKRYGDGKDYELWMDEVSPDTIPPGPQVLIDVKLSNNGTIVKGGVDKIGVAEDDTIGEATEMVLAENGDPEVSNIRIRRLDFKSGKWANSQIGFQAARTEDGVWTYWNNNQTEISEETLVKDLEVSPSVNAVKNTTLEKHIRSSASQAPQDQPVVQTSQPSKTATSTAKIVNSEEQKSPNGVKVLPSVDDATVPLVSTGLEKHIRSGPTQVGSSSLAPNSSLASTMSKLEKNIGSSSTDAKVSESQTEQTSKIATNKNSEQQLSEEAVIGGNGVKDDDSAASSTQSNSCCSISELIAGFLFVLIFLCLFAILPKLAEYWDDYLDKDSESEEQ